MIVSIVPVVTGDFFYCNYSFALLVVILRFWISVTKIQDVKEVDFKVIKVYKGRKKLPF